MEEAHALEVEGVLRPQPARAGRYSTSAYDVEGAQRGHAERGRRRKDHAASNCTS